MLFRSSFGEEYTLVAVSDYVLQHKKGAVVSNLSSSRALRDITENAGESYFASAVGEVNVVNEMKRVNAVIGGEGNGGVIVPDLHYGRDALIGTALLLSHLAIEKCTLSQLKIRYPVYHISKQRIDLSPDTDINDILKTIQGKYNNEKINTIDGLKIDFESKKEWVHLRRSNTEPIIRIYAEASDKDKADALALRIMSDIKNL